MTRFASTILVLALVAGSARPSRADPSSANVAVADFDYADTSGEARDQTAAHAARLRDFRAGLLSALTGEGVSAQPLRCGSDPCSVAARGADGILDVARRSGARYLVYGGIHKTSTLVEWMKIEMVDLATGKLLASKLLTFRGDTDEAYRRAARFTAQDVLLAPLRAMND